MPWPCLPNPRHSGTAAGAAPAAMTSLGLTNCGTARAYTNRVVRDHKIRLRSVCGTSRGACMQRGWIRRKTESTRACDRPTGPAWNQRNSHAAHHGRLAPGLFRDPAAPPPLRSRATIHIRPCSLGSPPSLRCTARNEDRSCGAYISQVRFCLSPILIGAPRTCRRRIPWSRASTERPP